MKGRKRKMSNISREEAFKLLKEYNKDSFHIKHALYKRTRNNERNRGWSRNARLGIR